MMAGFERRRIVRGLVAISGANSVSIFITCLIAVIMPLALHLESYAYWQLFSLFVSFAGFFVLGFNDGVYQKYASLRYELTLWQRFAAFKWVVLTLGGIGGVTVVASSRFFPHEERFAVVATATCIVFFGLNGFYIYTNQIGARYSVCASSILIERVSLLVGTLALFLSGVREYRLFVGVSVASSLFKLIYLLASTREVTLRRGLRLGGLRSEILMCFRVGFPVMLAILIGSSILVPSRLVVIKLLGAQAFALYSFALTAVLVTGTILSSLAQSLFPLYRKMQEPEFTAYIKVTHRILVIAGAGLLCLYFIASFAIQAVYPMFLPSLQFLGILFPLFIFQSKYVLLLTTIHRMRDRITEMLVVAVSGAVLNFVVSWSIGVTTRSTFWISVGTLITYVFWLTICWIAVLKRELIDLDRWNIIELALVAYFVACLSIQFWVGGWGSGMGLLTSLLSYTVVVGLAALLSRGWLRRETIDCLAEIGKP